MRLFWAWSVPSNANRKKTSEGRNVIRMNNHKGIQFTILKNTWHKINQIRIMNIISAPNFNKGEQIRKDMETDAFTPFPVSLSSKNPHSGL